MLKIELTEVVGWEHSIRGMRNPMNSWAKSDSKFGRGYGQYGVLIGPNDIDLMKRLRKGGSDDRKYLRMIVVYADITAPLYWWKEFDTYKVGTVANSCSTMHKIHAKEFTMDDFSCEHLDKEGKKLLHQNISYLNRNREKFNETKDKQYWWNMIQSLGTNFNQKRTVMLNYEVLINIYHARRNHKLTEWHTLCDWIESLPYSELITGSESV